MATEITATELTVTPSTLVNALKVGARTKRPVCVWGEPGIGKSSIVRQVADALFAAKAGLTIDEAGGAHDATGNVVERPYLIDLRLALLDAVDLRGLPKIIGDLVEWMRPGFVPIDGYGILFLDELTRAPMMVQNAALQLVYDRKIGEHKLGDDWIIVAACNREQDGGGVQKMNGALADRFIHLNLVPDLNEWSNYALDHSFAMEVIGYTRWRPENAQAFNPKAHASPTLRSWESVSDIVKLELNDYDTELALYAGCVGQAVAGEFMPYLQMWRTLPSVDAILLDPENAPVPTEASVLYAVCGALARRADPSNLGRIATYLARPGISQEYAVFTVKGALQHDPTLAATPEFTTWAIRNQDAF